MAVPRIGDLRHRIDITRETEEPDNDVGSVKTYALLARVDAEITPVGTTLWQAGQVAGTTYQDERFKITHRFTIRYRHGLHIADYIFHATTQPDGTIITSKYRILRSAPWQGRNRFLIIEAELQSASEDCCP